MVWPGAKTIVGPYFQRFVGSGGRVWKGARKLAQRLKRAGVRDVTCKIYPNVRHELLNESCREEATADFLGAILDFLSRREPGH